MSISGLDENAGEQTSDEAGVVGDEDFLRFQPYRQLSVSNRANQKLAPRYYGPFRITQRVRPVASALALSKVSRIHPIFHVSLLKKKISDTVQASPLLPEATTSGEL